MERNPALVLEGMALAGYAAARRTASCCAAPSTRARSRRSMPPPRRRGPQGCSARTSMAAASRFRHHGARGRGLLRRRRGDRPPRVRRGTAGDGLGAPAVPRAARASTACRRSSTTPRRSRTSRSSRGTDPRPIATSRPGATPGTKLVCFNERFARPGVYEVRFGTSMRELCEELAGGMRDGHTLRGAADRRPARPGSCRRRWLDTTLEFDALAAGRLHGRPRRGSSRFDEQTDMRALARHLLHFGAHESCGKSSRAGSACAAPTRCSPPTRRSTAHGSRSCSRRSSSAACARTAAACRRRSAVCSRTSPTSWGSPDAGHDRRRRRSRSSRARPCSRRSRRRRQRADALLRRTPGAVRRLPRVPRRRAGAKGRSRRARRRAGRAWRSTPGRDRAPGRTAVVELVLSELPQAPAPHTELARSRARVGVEGQRWPGETHPRRPRRAPPLPRLPARALHLLRALRARLRRGPGGVRAHGNRTWLRR